MIIDVDEEKKHTVIKTAVETCIDMLRRKYGDEYEGIQKMRECQRQHIALKEKIKDRREEMLEDALTPIIDEVLNNPNASEEIRIQWELSPNFVNGGGNVPVYEDSEIRNVKHNIKPNPHQEEIYQQDLAKRRKQSQIKKSRPKLPPMTKEDEVAFNKQLKTTTTINDCIDKIGETK